MHLVEKAIALAVEAHAGEVDKQGKPYILHPLHLMMQMETAEEMITAVLHDVVEDTPTTLEDLRQQGFPEAVLEALALLTHDTASTSYKEYVAAVKPNPLARKVKLADSGAQYGCASSAGDGDEGLRPSGKISSCLGYVEGVIG
jgi:(p)ppGpp synthase/HD superfamily hydrolase